MHKIGDTVHIRAIDSAKFAGTYTVTKVNPSTYALTGERAASLKAPHAMVHAGPLGSAPTPVLTQVPVPVFLDNGTVVKVRAKNVDPDALYVVTGQVSRGYRVFPLGGSSRYYTGIPGDRLTVVTEIHDWKVQS